jgi:hypothetical protein
MERSSSRPVRIRRQFEQVVRAEAAECHPNELKPDRRRVSHPDKNSLEPPVQPTSRKREKIPTGRTARPGPGGGRPAELYRAGRAWKHGTPIHRIQRGNERK